MGRGRPAAPCGQLLGAPLFFDCCMSWYTSISSGPSPRNLSGRRRARVQRHGRANYPCGRFCSQELFWRSLRRSAEAGRAVKVFCLGGGTDGAEQLRALDLGVRFRT